MATIGYSDLITERGGLRDDVKPYMRDHIEKEADALLACGQNESEIRTIGSVILSVVQDRITRRVAECSQSKTKSTSP